MNIVVCAKVIPASSATIELDPNTKCLIRKGVAHELDPAAASALEEGLRLAEKHGGEVRVVTMGIGDVTIGAGSSTLVAQGPGTDTGNRIQIPVKAQIARQLAMPTTTFMTRPTMRKSVKR